MSPTQLQVGAPIPYVLTKQQLAAATGYSLRQIDTFRRLRNHPAIKELDAPGHVRFCGRTVKAWLDGRKDDPRPKRTKAA